MPRGIYERTPKTLAKIREATAKRKVVGSCKVDDCDSAVVKKGMCNRHYMRQYRGLALEGPFRVSDYGDQQCAQNGCERGAKGGAYGYCQMHYHRLFRHGDPSVVKGGPGAMGEKSAAWKGDSIGYQQAHVRVKTLRKDENECIHCRATTGLEWALNWEVVKPSELCYGDNGHGYELAYSLKTDHYIRLCTGCHRTFDWAQK